MPWSTVVALPMGRTWWCSASVERTDVTRDYAASSITRRCCCSRSADMAAPPTTAPLAGRWARIPSRRRRPVTDEPARVSRGGAQSRHLAPATFFVAPVSEMTFGGRSRSGPLAPSRRWSRMGAMRGRARSRLCAAVLRFRRRSRVGCCNMRPTPRRALRKLLRGERNRHCRRGGNGLFGGWHRWLPRGHDQVQQHGRADCAAPCGGGGASTPPRPGGDLRGQQVRSRARQRQVAGPEEEHGARQAAPGAGQRACPPARGAELRDAEPCARARAHPGQRGGGPTRKGSGTGRNSVK